MVVYEYIYIYIYYGGIGGVNYVALATIPSWALATTYQTTRMMHHASIGISVHLVRRRCELHKHAPQGNRGAIYYPYKALFNTLLNKYAVSYAR